MAHDDVGELRRRLEAAEAGLEEMHREGRGRPRRRPSARGVVVGVGLALLLAPVGVAATGHALREGIRNGTSRSETEIIGKFDATTGAKGGYVTRQSNTQTGPKAGGGAIYGCRGAAGGTAAGSAPCVRASNLADGLAFEFASKSGPAGLFQPGSPGDPPFAVAGTGKVDNLNTDKVDGLDAEDIIDRARAGGGGATGPQGEKGDTGPQGPRGEKGDKGDPGTNAATSMVTRSAEGSIPAGTSGSVTVHCEPGEKATGGGGHNGNRSDAYLYQSVPLPTSGTPTAWVVYYRNTGTSTIPAYAFVICVSP